MKNETKPVAPPEKGRNYFMKKLNNESTRIFLKLIKKLGDKEHVELKAKEFMPLTIELLDSVETSAGIGKLYRIAHAYIQNGDRMRDPEMCFIVVPGINECDTLIYPQMYQ